MKNLNKKSLILSIFCFFIFHGLALASDENVNNTTTTSTETTISTVDSSIKLNGKIDGYKVILSWNKYIGGQDFLGYKLIIKNQNETQKTVSVSPDKTTLENWDSKPGINKYQIYVMVSSGEIAKSNELSLKMGVNGGYDLGDKTTNTQNTIITTTKNEYKCMNIGTRSEGYYDKDGKLIKYDNCGSSLNEYKCMNIGTRSEGYYDKDGNLIKYENCGGLLNDEQKTKSLELMKSFEENLTYVRGKITKTNLDEIKLKLESLKLEYIKKAEDLSIPKAKEMINARLEIFYKNNISNLKQEDNKKPDENKTQKQVQNQGSAFKYKQQFAKKLEGILPNLSTEKIKTIISKINSLVEKYNNNSDLSQEKKYKFILQLNALKELLQEKLDDLENGINLDEIINQ